MKPATLDPFIAAWSASTNGKRTKASLMALALAAFLPTSAAAIDPTLRNQHIQLAQSDLQIGNWAKSLARFRWLLLESAPDAQYEIAYQNTIASITNEHPLRFGFDAALLPSTNISKASSHRIFVTDLGEFLIDSAEDRQSGIGLRAGVSATTSHAYKPGRNLYATGLLSADIYKQQELQVGQFGLSLGHEWISSGRQINLSLAHNGYVYRDLADRNDPDFTTDTVSLSTYNRLSPRLSLSTQTSVLKAKYQERDYNNGLHSSFQIAPKYRLGSQDALSLKLGVQAVNIEADHLSYAGGSLGIFWDRLERSGIRWSIGLERHWREYDTEFPSLSYQRYDVVSDIILSASHPRITIKGMTPVLRCTLRDHGSNVALYDYNSKDCSVSFNYQF